MYSESFLRIILEYWEEDVTACVSSRRKELYEFVMMNLALGPIYPLSYLPPSQPVACGSTLIRNLYEIQLKVFISLNKTLVLCSSSEKYVLVSVLTHNLQSLLKYIALMLKPPI